MFRCSAGLRLAAPPLMAACALLILSLSAPAQMASVKQDIRRVGARLACQCGCPDTVASCSMLGCSFSHPAKEKIAKMQAAGVPDSTIIDDFVKAYGKGI